MCSVAKSGKFSFNVPHSIMKVMYSENECILEHFGRNVICLLSNNCMFMNLLIFFQYAFRKVGKTFSDLKRREEELLVLMLLLPPSFSTSFFLSFFLFHHFCAVSKPGAVPWKQKLGRRGVQLKMGKTESNCDQGGTKSSVFLCL